MYSSKGNNGIRSEEKNELVNILNMHFSEGLTQSEIAKKSNVSNTIISRKIKKGIEHRLVDYYFQDETAYTVNLEKQLEERYQLDEVIVTPAYKRSPEMIEYEVSKAAAFHLLSQIEHVSKIGLTWGGTIWRFISAVPHQSHPNLCIIPLCGGIGSTNLELHSNSLAFELAERFSCDYTSLYAPAIVSSEELKAQLEQMDSISTVLKRGREVDMAFVGIGGIHPETSILSKLGYINKTEYSQLKKQGAVGDIGCMFFDKSGNEVVSDFNKKVVAVELANLREIPDVVGIACGVHKAEAVKGCLNGKYLNTLIIDSQLANQLLED